LFIITEKTRTTETEYILFEYIDPTEVGVDISLPEVELRKPRNLFLCVSEEREDREQGSIRMPLPSKPNLFFSERNFVG
jgi:hypothetical protein